MPCPHKRIVLGVVAQARTQHLYEPRCRDCGLVGKVFSASLQLQALRALEAAERGNPPTKQNSGEGEAVKEKAEGPG